MNECSTNGKCTAPNACSCYPGFKEPDCLQSIECVQLNNCNGNGVCVRNGTECACYGGYQGTQCEIIQCDKVQNCTARGKCVEPDLCECDKGYKGEYCNETTCESLSFCSFNGRCDEQQKCVCDLGWSGRDCSLVDCSQVNFCSGNGICIEPNRCQCFQNYDGQLCNAPIGENLFSPRFDSDIYKTRVNELATIGTFIIKLNASDADKNGTRSSLIKFSIQTIDDFEYFEIDEQDASMRLKKSLLLIEKSTLLVHVLAYDQGTPRKSANTILKVYLDRSLSCNDILNMTLSEISITKSSVGNVYRFELKPRDLNNRNLSYSLINLQQFLTHFVFINENAGTLLVNASIFLGSYELNVMSKQVYDTQTCEKSMRLRLNVRSEPVTTESSSTTSTSVTSTTSSSSSPTWSSSLTTIYTATTSSLTSPTLTSSPTSSESFSTKLLELLIIFFKLLLKLLFNFQ